MILAGFDFLKPDEAFLYRINLPQLMEKMIFRMLNLEKMVGLQMKMYLRSNISARLSAALRISKNIL